MSNASAQTAPAWTGDAAPPDSRRSRCGTRRRLLVLSCLILLVVAGVAANYGPLRHYQEARGRLETVAAEVASLEEQRAALQAQLGKLGEAGYLEGLARQELTYARPDEELYIVTGPTTDESAGGVAGSDGGVADAYPVVSAASASEEALVPSAGVGAAVPGAGRLTAFGVGALVPGADVSTGDEAGRAGVLERIFDAVAALF